MTAQPIHDNPERKYEVTPLELFFDLVFVFAVSQLSHHLLTHLSWRGAAETVVIAAASMTLITLITGTFALAGTVALWALSFGRSHRLVLRHLEETSDPIRASRYAVNALMVMVAGLIAVAVANEKVIAHPHEHASLALSLLLGGGPILFLAAQGWYLWAVPNVRSQLHLIGVVAVLLVGLATLAVPPYVALLLVGASVSTLAILAR